MRSPPLEVVVIGSEARFGLSGSTPTSSSQPHYHRALGQLQFHRLSPNKMKKCKGTLELTPEGFRIFSCVWSCVFFELLPILSLSPPFLSVSYLGCFLANRFSIPFLCCTGYRAVDVCVLFIIPFNCKFYKHLCFTGKFPF